MWCVQEVLRLKLYLLRQKWTMNEIFIFFKIVPLAFNKRIPTSLLLKLQFGYDLKQHSHISLNVPPILISLTLEMDFQFRKQKVTSSWVLSVQSVLFLHNPVLPKTAAKNYGDLTSTCLDIITLSYKLFCWAHIYV